MGRTVNILRRTVDDSCIVECAFCGGDGKFFPDNEWLGCPVCEGTGAVRFPPGTEELSPCPECSGSGQAHDFEGRFTGEPCERCRGTGALDLSSAAPRVLDSPPDDFWGLLHPEVVETSRARFDSGQYADAVEAAFKHFNAAVKERAQADAGDRDGATLMTHVFSLNRPVLRLANLGTETGRNIQQGYMLMFQGGMIGIRNPKAHHNLVITRDRAVHLLFVASLFMHKLEEATPAAE